jgi:hypothetical protein
MRLSLKKIQNEVNIRQAGKLKSLTAYPFSLLLYQADR